MSDSKNHLITGMMARIGALWKTLGHWRHGVVFLIFMTPFSIFRHIRIHGDEKVYVGQALEMLRAGHLCQQLQFGDVNYIKGPTHYLFLILGHHIFGFSMISTVYMNLIFAALAVVALRYVADVLLPKASQLKAVPAWLFASSGAFVLFTFSSQMDSGVTSLYAIALSLSVLARHSNRNIHFFMLWLSVGFTGTLKSPLHSCLLGISVLVHFALVDSSFKKLFSSPAKILSIAAGVALGGAGYLIPFLLDQENWINSYILREQVTRVRFNYTSSGFVLNNFAFHVFPWTILVLHAAYIFLKRVKGKEFKWDEITIVSLVFLVPTFLFFFGLGYLAPWYGLPILASLALLIVAQLQTRNAPFQDLAHAIIPFTALFICIVFICHVSFFDGTPWWKGETSLLLTTLFLASFLFFEAVISSRKIPQRTGVLVGLALFWAGSLGLTATLGESEMTDVRSLISKHNAPLNYNNLEKYNYSEWGYMAYMTGQPTFFSNSYDELLHAGRAGQWLVFTNQTELNGFWDWLKARNANSISSLQPQVHIWRRWPRNSAQLKELWRARVSTENIWDKTTRHFMLVRFGAHTSQVSAQP